MPSWQGRAGPKLEPEAQPPKFSRNPCGSRRRLNGSRRHTSFVRCRGAMANFTAARLEASAWKSCDRNKARFTGSSLTEAVFPGSE